MANWRLMVKRVVSVGLLLGCAGYYANARYRLTSSYAVVAAPAIALHAPRDGRLKHSVRPFTVVAAGTEVGSVSIVPDADLDVRAATVELQTANAEVESLQNLIAVGEGMRDNTQTHQTSLGWRRAQHLKRLADQATAEVEAKRAASEGAQLARNRAAQLCPDGLMTTQECEAIRTKAEINKRELEAAQTQVDIARFLVQSSQSGADIGQSIGSEIAYARQRADDLTTRLAFLRQQLATQEARVRALELRVSPPPIGIATGARSRIWSALRENGAIVAKGDPLFEVLDCEELFIFATVSDARYERLHVGMRAIVTVEGRRFEGTVAQLLGPYGSFSQNKSMEPQPPVILNNMDATSAAVAVSVPEYSSAVRSACPVGTRAEVRFVRD